MKLARTLMRALPWGLVAAQSVLADRLLRHHERAMTSHNKLFARLERIERRLDALASEPLAPTGEVFYRTVRLNSQLSFEIAIDARLRDPISQAIANGDSWFLDDYRVLLDSLRPGDRVLDLGGHVGTFGLAAAALGCEVVCVEAAPQNVALLSASVARNGFERMRVVHAAVSDQAGTLAFVPNGPWGTIANDAIRDVPALVYGGAAAPVAQRLTPVEVPALTVDGLLDELGWERVDFVKLDIEGAEVTALRGMAGLLAQQDAPVVLYESNAHTLRFFDETTQRLAAIFHDYGYTTFVIEPERLVPFSLDHPQYRCVVNCLAVKGQPSALTNRPLVAAPSFEEIVRTIISQAFSQWTHDRAHVARILAEVGPALRADPRVMLALRLLCRDADADVRTAAAWFKHS